MSIKTINLKAEVGQRVLAQNYRRRPAVYEYGTVRAVETRFYSENRQHTSYTVLLDRESRSGNICIIYVGDDSIELSNEG